MIVIVCTEDRGGMLFNNRRVSKDRIVLQRVLKLSEGKKLWIHPFSEKLFEEESSENLYVDEKFLEKAEEEDFCFVEGENLAEYEGKITEIVLYKWNRDYPADVFFEVDLSKWRLEERKEFSGYSHEKITKEIYNRQGVL